ncbi:MAG: hypothetical protein HQL45_08690 [Alphaproteobacteria bacterium]|nr:hypothetical protein [Alphaproteobacteria bacterium]
MTDHIQIGALTPRIQYTANGAQTVFPYAFPIFENADMEVWLDDALQNSGFTVAGAGVSTGGTVTFTAAPANGVLVTLRRNIAIARTSDFQEGGAFRAKVINDELDRLTASLQQVATSLGRSLVLSPVDPADSLELPALTDRASALLGFDANGLPLAYPVSGFIGPQGPQGPQGAPGTGTGDVVGPASATDANIALFDGVTGKLIKDGGVALSGKANTSHAHVASDLSDFTEAAQDVVGAMVQAAGGSYDDGAGTVTFPAGSTGALSETITAFTASGTWTKPAGLLWIEVIVTGGGAGGCYNTSGSGPGGGAGGTAIKKILAASLGATESVTIGAGAAKNTTTSGGTSSFGAHCSATGGASNGNQQSDGGGGGVGSSGDVNLSGGSGGSGSTTTIGCPGGTGGASYWGGGGEAAYGAAVANAPDATVYGTGGGGGAGNGDGGAGKAGIVVVREFKN